MSVVFDFGVVCMRICSATRIHHHSGSWLRLSTQVFELRIFATSPAMSQAAAAAAAAAGVGALGPAVAEGVGAQQGAGGQQGVGGQQGDPANARERTSGEAHHL